MRTLLIVLMMALAPLRVGAGEVMAIGMLAQQMAAAHHGPEATPVHPVVKGEMQGPHADCMGHADESTAVAEPDADADQVHVATDCPSCSVCQACSVPALAVQAHRPPFARFTHAVPAFGGTAHASAAPAPGLKPPIS